MIQRVRTAIFGHQDVLVYECRRCGTTVPTPGATCPDCGNDEIAQYLIE